MILKRVIRDLLQPLIQRPSRRPTAHVNSVQRAMPSVLNVGGNSKETPIPEYFDGWHHLLLDIDATCNPDILCDARQLSGLEPGQFDAVYCSHNLEHYYKHDVAKVLKGFLHVLKPNGFAEIRVPDLDSVMRRVVAAGWISRTICTSHRADRSRCGT